MDPLVAGAPGMRRIVWGAAATLGLAAMLLAGCSSETPGQAQSTPTTGTPASSDSQNGTPSASASQAPKVATPLDAIRFINNPCSALTSTDLAGLHVDNAINGGARHNAGGVQCTWSGEAAGGIGIGWETEVTDGLSDLYAKSDTIAYWKPTAVSGYPAAYGDAISDGRAQGDCVINVAVNDHLYFNSQFTDPSNADQSCALAEQAAVDVIRNLGGS